MKMTTIREVQHNLSRILRWVEDGEVVVVTRHKRVVAHIVPSTPSDHETKWPDFAGRMKSIWDKAPSGKSASRIIIDERTERS